jgi:hypothetical protein
MFRPTPQKMAGPRYVTPVIGHKAYTGKEEEEELHFYKDCIISVLFA